MTSSLRRPRFGSAGTGGVASYVLHCRRVAQQQADAADVDVDEPNAEKAVGHGIGTSIHAEKSAAHTGSNDGSHTMDQCIDLLGDHLKTFRDMCLRADALAAESSEGAAVAASTSKAQPDEIPPQLLRVVRFFRHKWPPLKRALLRPPEPLSRAQQQGGDGKSSGAVIIEVGSPALRLRLARALHARGMLSLAEVDELAAALEWQQREQVSENAEGVMDIIDDDDASPTKKRKLDKDDDDDDMLAARLRMALSRLPSDAGPVSTKSGGGGSIGGNTSASSIEKARKGMRYARTVLSECESRWNNITDGGCSAFNSSACPSPWDVADWALTAFTGIVLANGIDFRPSRTGWVGSGVKFQPDDSNLEQSLAALLLPPTSRADSKSHSPLARAVRAKIETYLSPAMVNDLTDIHLLSLSRLFACAPFEEVVKNILVKSIVDCSKRSGGVGLQNLSKLLASYAALVESDIPVLGIEGLEATLKEMILEKHDGEKVDSAAAGASAAGASAAGSDCGNSKKRKERALCFLGAIIQTAKFLRL